MSTGTVREILAALGALDDDAQLTFTVRKRDLVHAFETREDGARSLTTKQAAKVFGYTADFWRRRAEAGEIDGAYQHTPGAPWHLPRTSCEALVARLRRAGTDARKAAARGAATSTANRSRPRGPQQQPAPASAPARVLPLAGGASGRAAQKRDPGPAGARPARGGRR